MRDLSKIIDQMLEIIPEEHPIVPEFKKIRTSVLYAAPENQSLFWQRCAKELQDHFGNSETGDELAAKLQIIFNRSAN
jgi:hypothetical protein